MAEVTIPESGVVAEKPTVYVTGVVKRRRGLEGYQRVVESYVRV